MLIYYLDECEVADIHSSGRSRIFIYVSSAVLRLVTKLYWLPGSILSLDNLNPSNPGRWNLSENLSYVFSRLGIQMQLNLIQQIPS